MQAVAPVVARNHQVVVIYTVRQQILVIRVAVKNFVPKATSLCVNTYQKQITISSSMINTSLLNDYSITVLLLVEHACGRLLNVLASPGFPVKQDPFESGLSQMIAQKI